eukprot:11481974-Alexandrium_andersonii.AAC.1
MKIRRSRQAQDSARERKQNPTRRRQARGQARGHARGQARGHARGPVSYTHLRAHETSAHL